MRNTHLSLISLFVVSTNILAGPTIQQPSPMVYDGNPGGHKILEEGQPPALVHATKDAMDSYRKNVINKDSRRTSSSTGPGNNLYYHNFYGVETEPKVYLVLWGSQWQNNDPSGEEKILTDFLNGVGGSPWLKSVTQYCQGVPSNTVFCNGSGSPAGNPNILLAGVMYDYGSAAPSSPTQSQFAAEALNALVIQQRPKTRMLNI